MESQEINKLNSQNKPENGEVNEAGLEEYLYVILLKELFFPKNFSLKKSMSQK